MDSRSVSDVIKNLDAEQREEYWLFINKIVTVYLANSLLILAIIVPLIIAAINFPANLSNGELVGIGLGICINYLHLRFIGGYYVRLWRWCSVFPYRVLGAPLPTGIGIGTMALEYLEEEEKKVTKAEYVAENAEEEARVAIDSLRELEQKIKSKRKGIDRTLQELLEHNEDERLEFKASMWTKYKTVNKIATNEIVDMEKKAYFLQDEILHTVAAFLNAKGGTLLIGVKDKPLSWEDRPAEVFGVEADYKYLGKNNRDADGYIQAVYQVLNNGFGETYTTATYVKVSVVKFNGKEICRVDVKPLRRIRNGEIYIIEKNGVKNEQAFYVRAGSSSQKYSIQTAAGYIRDNFPGYTPPDNSSVSSIFSPKPSELRKDEEE